MGTVALPDVDVRATHSSTALASSASTERSEGRLWKHAIGYTLLLAAWLAVSPLNSAFTVDEGSYALGVEALQDGTWALEGSDDAFDPEFDRDGFRSEVTDEGRFVLGRGLAYLGALFAVTNVVPGALGLHLVPAVGALAAAVVAWRLAAATHTVNPSWAFWLAGAGPVLVNSMVLWAHTWSTALSGLAVLAAVRQRHRLSRSWTLAMVAALMGGVLIRSEGILFAGALTFVVLADAFRARDARRVAWSAAVGVTVGCAHVVNTSLSSAITGGTGTAMVDGQVPFLTGRLQGLVHVLMASGDDGVLGRMALVAAVMTVAGAVLIRTHRRTGVYVVIVGGALLATFHLVRFEAVTTGLFVAWVPVAIALFVRPSEQVSRKGSPVGPLQLCWVTAWLFAVLVLVTQHSTGGGLEWGGRYLSPILVPSALLAACALTTSLQAVGNRRRPLVAGVMGVALVSSTVHGMVATDRLRREHDRVAAVVEQLAPDVIVTSHPAVGRLLWRMYPVEVVYVEDDAEVEEVLESVVGLGAERVAYVGNGDDRVTDVRGAAVEEAEDAIALIVATG